jgi:predicted nucleic acid-binding protein
VRRLVLDPTAVLTWFEPDGEHRALRSAYEAGDLVVVAPRQLPADLLSEVSRRGPMPPERLARVAAEFERLEFEVQDVPAAELARWLSAGLDARPAVYAALASATGVPLVTADADLRRVASDVLAAT